MTKDPLAGTAWSDAGTVAGFVQSPPNQTLMGVAAAERAIHDGPLLDIGCGAGRNAIPLAAQGWSVTGADLSWPMLRAAAERARSQLPTRPVRLVLAAMEHLPIQSGTVSFIVAHGIWNLASSTAQFRKAISEAARVARPDALLFVFTFSRNTLSPAATPVNGEEFIFTDFSGAPQCFLTAEQLVAELCAVGFVPDPSVPLIEHNRLPDGARRLGGPPVIYEGTFRYRR